MNRVRWSALLDGFCYAALTILVWGVSAPRRGLWQDDVQALGEAWLRSARPFGALFAPDASPLRRLTLLPSAIANATPHPVWALHLLCSSVWLAQALAAGWIVALLLPGRRWTRVVVVCLTLTATSDLTTGSPVALAYNMAALFLLAATGCGLLWLRRARKAALIASPILLGCSLLTMDVAFPALPFLVLLFVWFGARDEKRRAGALLAAWTIVGVPLGVVEWSFLHDPASYAAVALLPLSKVALVKRSILLWLENFAPWRWAFARPAWYPLRPSTVIPGRWMAAGSILAAALFLHRTRKAEDALDERGSPAPALNAVKLAVLFAMMALLVNAAYAGIWFSELHYRTHILSRVWASLAIGILAGWAATRTRRARGAAVVVVTAFVFFGAWGGMERQDFYLASWREHQRELASILDAAPALKPGTAVILRGTPPTGRYLATQADYLTAHWLRLLYDDPQLRTLRLDPVRGSGCAAAPGGIACWREGEASAYGARTFKPARFRYDELVLLDYDAPSGSWRLARSLRADPLVSGSTSDEAAYCPEQRIVSRPWTTRQRRLLLRG